MKEKVETLAQKIFKPIYLTHLIDLLGIIIGALSCSAVAKIFNKKGRGICYDIGKYSLMGLVAFIFTYPFTYLAYVARGMINEKEESEIEEC